MQIPQRSVVPCSGLTSWVYGANHAGITAVEPMGGRHPQRAPSSPWLFLAVPLFHQCGNRWQTLLLHFPRWGTSCYKFLLSNFPRISWSEPSGRKWISKWDDQIFDRKGNKAEISRCNLEQSFSQADWWKSILSPGCGWVPSILTVVFVLIGVLFIK